MKKDWCLFLSTCIILVNILILLVLKINLISQLLFASAVIIITFSGKLLLIKLKERFQDIIFFYISSFFCGVALAYFLGFLFFHQSISSLLHLHSLENASLVVFFILFPLSFLGYLKTRRSKSSISFSKEGLAFSLLLSSIISFFHIPGFNLRPFE